MTACVVTAIPFVCPFSGTSKSLSAAMTVGVIRTTGAAAPGAASYDVDGHGLENVEITAGIGSYE